MISILLSLLWLRSLDHPCPCEALRYRLCQHAALKHLATHLKVLDAGISSG